MFALTSSTSMLLSIWTNVRYRVRDYKKDVSAQEGEVEQIVVDGPGGACLEKYYVFHEEENKEQTTWREN